MMCVMLVDPSLLAGLWSTTGIIPPPFFISTEPHIHHFRELSYSVGHVDAESSDKIPKQHSSVRRAMRSSRMEKQYVNTLFTTLRAADTNVYDVAQPMTFHLLTPNLPLNFALKKTLHGMVQNRRVVCFFLEPVEHCIS